MIWIQVFVGAFLFVCGIMYVLNIVDDELRAADRSEEK
jgi:hypothetical protein